MDFLGATDISGQIPASFYTQMESKKWSDRKEALEIIEKATSVAKIQNVDLSELIRVLKKTIAKDSNIVVVTLAAKCLCQLARGLGSSFGPYTSSLTILFEKFKEKKPNVICVIRDATDSVFLATNLEAIAEDVIQFLDNKNPQIKSEMALFLVRIFSTYSQQVRNKKTLKPLINALMKTLSDMDATVRDNSAMAIGTAMKVIGEPLMMPLIADIEPIKIAKIKEFYDKAEIVTAPVNGQSHVPDQEMVNGQQTAPVSQTNGITDDGDDDEDTLYEMLDAVDISAQVPANFYTQMESKKWSDRKEVLEVIEKITSIPKIQAADYSELVRVLKKTVAKDSNIVVVTSAAKCLCQLAQGLRNNFAPYADSCLPVLFEKFKEKKPNVVSVLRDATDSAFIGTNLENIFEDVIHFLDNKNPQIKSEMALFLARAFSKHPAQVLNKKTLRPLINSLIKTLSDMDVTVRDNSAMAIGTAMKVTGEKLMMTLIADVEPIKIPKIKEFCEKAQVKKLPPSVLNAMNSAPMAPSAPIGQTVQPPARTSSATISRSANVAKRTLAKPGAPKPATSVPGPNATVKRTATIIKRSTATKRASGLPHPPPPPPPSTQAQPSVAPTQAAAPVPVYAAPIIDPPAHSFAAPNPPGPTSTPAKPIYVTTQVNSKFAKLDNFDSIIFRMISDDYQEIIQSFEELEELLTDDTETTYKNRINQIIALSCWQLSITLDSQKAVANGSDGISQSHKIKKVSDCLAKIFARKRIVSAASQQSIRFLLMQIFTLTQSCANANENEDTIAKSLNNLASAVIGGFEPAKIMCILTGLLNDPQPASIVEPIKKAIIRSMQSFK